MVSRVTDGTVTGHPLTLSLVEGIESIRVLSTLPSPGTQVLSLFKLIPEVIPINVRALFIYKHSCHKNNNRTVVVRQAFYT